MSRRLVDPPFPRTVANWMTRDVLAFAPDTGLETAARALVQHGVSGAPVVGSDGRALGVVSLFDLVDPDRDKGNHEGYPVFYHLSRGIAEILGDGVTASSGRVEEVMTRKVLAVDEDTTPEDASERLLEFGVHRLLVTRGDGVLVGIVSSIDLLRALLHAVR